MSIVARLLGRLFPDPLLPTEKLYGGELIKHIHVDTQVTTWIAFVAHDHPLDRSSFPSHFDEPLHDS